MDTENKQAEICTEEVVASMLQLARSGQYKYLPGLITATEELYPELSKDRIQEATKALADLLWDCDHHGYRTEYLAMKRRRGQSA